MTSSKPSKQRKALYTAPSHSVRKMFSAHLSEDLRKRYGRRSFPIRKGDSVKVVRGDFAGVEGKVSDVDRGARRIYLEGVTRERVGGQTVKIPIHPSNVILTSLNLDDKARVYALEGRQQDKGGSE
ncbi:MAG: 50S ribosomal protein L24 [Candidatus Bathyarchaeia archaeon]